MPRKVEINEARRQQLTRCCLVCGSPARPHSHYGAICCYSCRAFFRRNLEHKFVCSQKNELCEINEGTRTCCKFCRLKKCLDIGMRPNLVDTGSSHKINSSAVDIDKKEPIETTEVPLQVSEDEAVATEYFVFNPGSNSYVPFTPDSSTSVDQLQDEMADATCSRTSVGTAEATYSMMLNPAMKISAEEDPLGKGCVQYNQDDEGHRLVCEFLQMQRQMSYDDQSCIRDGGEPTNLNESSSEKSTSIIEEFKAALKKDAEEQRLKEVEKCDFDICQLLDEVFEEEKLRKVKDKKKPVSVVKPYSREGSLEESKDNKKVTLRRRNSSGNSNRSTNRGSSSSLTSLSPRSTAEPSLASVTVPSRLSQPSRSSTQPLTSSSVVSSLSPRSSIQSSASPSTLTLNLSPRSSAPESIASEPLPFVSTLPSAFSILPSRSSTLTSATIPSPSRLHVVPFSRLSAPPSPAVSSSSPSPATESSPMAWSSNASILDRNAPRNSTSSRDNLQSERSHVNEASSNSMDFILQQREIIRQQELLIQHQRKQIEMQFAMLHASQAQHDGSRQSHGDNHNQHIVNRQDHVDSHDQHVVDRQEQPIDYGPSQSSTRRSDHLTNDRQDQLIADRQDQLIADRRYQPATDSSDQIVADRKYQSNADRQDQSIIDLDIQHQEDNSTLSVTQDHLKHDIVSQDLHNQRRQTVNEEDSLQVEERFLTEETTEVTVSPSLPMNEVASPLSGNLLEESELVAGSSTDNNILRKRIHLLDNNEVESEKRFRMDTENCITDAMQIIIDCSANDFILSNPKSSKDIMLASTPGCSGAQLKEIENEGLEKSNNTSLVPVNKSYKYSKKKNITPKFRKFKVPYLEFTIEEEFLVTQLKEIRNLHANFQIDYWINKGFEKLMEDGCDSWYQIVTNKASNWSGYSNFMDQVKSIEIRAVKESPVGLIPDNFGKFPNTFMSSLLEYSCDNCMQMEAALFFGNNNAPNLYEQDLSMKQLDVTEKNSCVLEKYLGRFRDYPAIELTDINLFKSPWCSSYEDEQFYMETIKQLGEILNRYPKLIPVAGLMSILAQPKTSPYAKSKNLHRLFKSLATLMNRYMVTVNEDASKGSEDNETLVSLIMKLPRCSEIFKSKRIDL